MNVSVRWLRELAAGLEGSPEELAERLTMAAVPVDAVEPVGEELEGIRVARVLEVRQHPGADRLLLCSVDAGGEAVEVVCGAPVVEENALYPYVAPGASLPGGMRIERREIRGRTSHGMLCSEHELGLGRDRSGILRLSDDLEPGEPLAEALGLPDVRLVLDLTPNRVDLACHVGVARELAPEGEAALFLRPSGAEWVPTWSEGRRSAEAAGLGVQIEDADRCPRYLGAVVRGVRVRPSPPWLAGRLRAVGVRPVNNVVDATNYVLLELNQPIHAFDLDTLDGPEIRVRAAESGERIRTLDGEDRKLGPEVTVIADRGRPVAVAGVMGGEDSEVTAETRDVFLECAAFEPSYVRRSARALGLSSEASYRFERGIDEGGLERALARCVELVLASAGGEAVADAHRVGKLPSGGAIVRLRPERVRAVLGIEPGPYEVRRLLVPLGFEPVEPDASAGEPAVGAGAEEGREASGDASEASAEADELLFRSPGWRRDVIHEIDLVEEVARRHGYDRFPSEPRRVRVSVVADDPDWERADRMRELLVGRGLLEARSSSFVPREQLPEEGGVEVLNPLSAAEGWLRAGLMPVLLRRLEHNLARGLRDVRLFEIGSVFERREDGVESGLRPGGAVLGPFHEQLRAALLLTGRRHPPHWTDPDEADLDVWDIKGLASEMAEALCSASVEPLEAERPRAAARLGGDWLGGEAFRIVKGGKTVGVCGRVRGEAIDAPPWAGSVWALELALEAVEVSPSAMFRGISAFPAVRRDLAVTVPLGVDTGALESAIRAAAPEILESFRLFDVYEGEGIADDRRSLAWTFRFRSRERTLTDEEVDAAVVNITAALEGGYDARVRAS